MADDPETFHARMRAVFERARAEAAGRAGRATAAAPGRFALACSLRGEATGETRPCKTCGGVRDVPLYACPVHGVCTAEGAPVEGVRWCRTCPDKRPDASGREEVSATMQTVLIDFPHGL